MRTTMANPKLRPVRMEAWAIEIRCFVLIAEAVQQKDARNLKMACDPDWEMLRVNLFRMCAFSEQHQRICSSIEMVKRQRNQRSNCQCLLDYWKSKRVPEIHLFLLYWLCQSLWLRGSQQTGKFLKRWEYQTTWPASWEICVQIRKQQLELDMEQTGSKLRKEYIKAEYCHPAYLTYMQSTTWEMPGWMKHKLESRLLGEISITLDV